MNKQGMKFKYSELVVGDISKRGNIIDLYKTDFKKIIGKKDCYLSLFRFDDSVLNYLKLNHSLRGFDSSVYFSTLYVDFDSPDVGRAKSDLESFIQDGLGKYLSYEEMDTLRISFSGNKGFHLGIPADYFKGLEGSQTLDLRARGFVETVLNQILEDTGSLIETVDLKIYNKTRIFRLLNSINGKTGLYKIPLTYDELLKFSAEQIQSLADKQRWVKYNNNIDPDTNLSFLLKEVVRETSFSEESKPLLSIGDDITNGARNDTLFKLGCKYINYRVPLPEIREILYLKNASLREPLEDWEVDTIFTSVKRYNRVEENIPLEEKIREKRAKFD